jgi:hypothetical protein
MALSTAAISGFADYEQLVGGVETLFGTQGQSMSEYAVSVGKSVLEINKEYNRLNAAQELVMRNSGEAFKTAGLSANEYMETVTSFSAALISSLDGDTLKAAEKADQAIVDLSDNANKMGSSMESIQNAYQGFAKQNYTMLDNLKLGYGGTKEEMQRLLDDAEAISGIEYDISSYADVVDAIHVIQTEMGITGTTAKEASTTITGSVSAMKASWKNLLVGVADGSQNLETLIDDFVGSVETVAENILPVAEQALLGIGDLVEELFPVIVDRIPEIINNVLPQLLQSGMNMITTLLNGIQENLPEIVAGAILIIQQLVTTFISLLPQIIQMGLDLVVQLALGIAQALPELIPTVVTVMLQIVDTLINNIDMLVDAAIVLITALTEGIINALPILIEKMPELVIKLVNALVENAPKLLEAALKLVMTLAEALINYLPILVGKVPELIRTLKNKFIELVSSFKDVGKNIIEGIANGITEKWDWLTGKVKDLANSLFETAKAALDIHSPSRKFRYLGEMCIAGWEQGSEGLFDMSDMTRNINASLGTITANVSGNSGGTVRGITQYITINKEDSSPDEIARAIRLESRYRLMGGYA